MKRPKGFVTRQAKRLSDGEINRRRFVMSALSAGVTMPTALSLASKAEARVPKPGGLLRMGLAEGSARDTLDPAQASNAFTRALAYAQGNSLTEINEKGQFASALAQSLAPASGHRRWIVTLRPDVSFQNGAPLTAEDVIATLDRHRQALLPDVTTLDTLAPDRIAITLTGGDTEFPCRLADPRLIILARTSTPERPIGTGPYRLEQFEPGHLAEFTRHPGYWKTGRAHFDRVRLRAMPNPLERQTALMTGEIDYADRIDPRSVALLRQVPTLAVTETASSRHLAVTFRRHVAPFDRTELRAALCRAIPGPTLAERLLFGHGRGADLAGGFDLESAAHLFRRSGHDGPVPISVADDLLARDAARLIADSAARAGIVLTPTDAPAGCRIEIIDGPPVRTADTHVPLWINDIAAHVKTLVRAGDPRPNLQDEGARLIERGWFA